MRKRLSSNDEVCHYWANQVQSEGYVENLFFVGRELYSYGSHFLLGKIHDNITLINSDDYSVSTRQHKSLAIRALGYKNYIEVPYPDPTNIYCHEDNVKYLKENFDLALKKYHRARKYQDLNLRDAKRYSDEAKKYCEAFNITMELCPEINEDLLNEVKEATKREAKRKREEAKKEKEALKEQIKDEVLRFRSMGVIPSMEVLKHLGTDLARIKDNEVMTSQRARVPLHHVKRLFLAIDNGLEVAGKKVGHYTITSYKNDVLKIGCHKFNKEEIENMRLILALQPFKVAKD